MITFSPDSSDAIPRHTPAVSAALHLFPGAVAFLAYAAAMQLAPFYNWPKALVQIIVLSFVLSTIELGHLALVARRFGGWSSPLVNAFRRPLRPWQYGLYAAGLLVLAMAIYTFVAPLEARLGLYYPLHLPEWLGLGDMADYKTSNRLIYLIYIVLALAMNIIVPLSEELYYRGYLLPRAPYPRWAAVIFTSALFAVSHFWQPNNWLSIFLSVLPLVTTVLLLRNVRVAIFMHISLNLIGIAPTIIEVSHLAGFR